MPNHETRIEVLPKSVVEKIAAGEVIERPASVLKELIENAIDAGATKIDVVIEDAGFSLLQTNDNGSGMSLDNIKKCLLAHATSKIKNADDLWAISTMGFRGEALASIAAVSRFTVTSSNTDDGIGHTLVCEGGVSQDAQPAAHVRGTTMVCRDLFFNVPARKKFMKTRKAERIALLKCIEQLVIPFPSIHFTAVADGKKVFDVPVADSVLSRIAQVTGPTYAKHLGKAVGTTDGMAAQLYFPLEDTGEIRPRFQYLFVNLRRVDCDAVLYAVREAFAKLVQRDFRPSFFCFIDVEPAQVDVNVHPTKQKVKFEKERELFGFIYGIVSRALAPAIEQKKQNAPQDTLPLSLTKNIPAVGGLSVYEHEPQTYGVAEEPTIEDGIQTVLPFPAQPFDAHKNLATTPSEAVQLTDAPEPVEWALISCYQIHGMYIIAPIKNGILLIDQHAAHERILFEQAIDDMEYGRAMSQQLLFPVVFELSVTEKAVIESAGDYFRSFGFELEDFGGNTVSVSAIPAFMKSGDVERSARDMIRYLLDEKDISRFPDPRFRFAAAFACGAAIKAGQKLLPEEMNALLNNLFSAKNPYTCPHGRPTVVRMSLDELSRRFLR